MLRFCFVLFCAVSALAAEPLTITLQDAIVRATANAPQLLTANIAALLAREDTVQAKAGLLPSVNGVSQYIYTQPNGSPSGIFVSNDGPHIYNNQVAVHGDIYSPVKLADYRKTRLAEQVARARADIAARGVIATVVQNFYGMVSAVRKLANARQSEKEAGQFAEITTKQERGGEVAHSDTVKAEIKAGHVVGGSSVGGGVGPGGGPGTGGPGMSPGQYGRPGQMGPNGPMRGRPGGRG